MEENSKKTIIPNKLESTERELFSAKKEPKQVQEHSFSDYHKDVPRSWGKEEETMSNKKPRKHLMHSRKFRQIMFVAFLFFTGSVLFTILTFFQGGTTVSNNNIDIVVLGNSFVDGGEELPLQVRVANRNRTDLEIADMRVEYSRGAGGANDVVRQRISLGEIKSGKVVEEIVPITVFGEQGTVRDIVFTLEYRVSNSNAIFVKEYVYPVNIANSPVDVTVSGPSNVISNQNFDIEVLVIQNSTEAAENMMVSAVYPSGFKFVSASPEPDFGNDTWVLGDLAPGAEREITITGNIKAQSGEERIVTIISGSQDPDDEQEIGVQFTSTPLPLTVGAPFISASVAYGNTEGNEFVVQAGQQLTFNLNWENRLSNSLSNAEIVLNLSGSGFDPARVSVNQGFFNTNTNQIIWNGNNNSNLSSVAPGESGSLFFTITPKTGVSNPVINLSVDASGVVSGSGNTVEEVENIYTGTIRIESNIQLSGSVLYSDGPLNNVGPIPPTVGQETTYTVVWTVSTSVNDLEDAKVTAEIPSYVVWKNQTFPNNEDVEYNPTTREVVWDIGDVNAGSGSNGAKTAYFTLGIIPSASHLGGNPLLIGSAELEGIDSFTSGDISRTISQLTTSLFGDSSYNPATDGVVQ